MWLTVIFLTLAREVQNALSFRVTWSQLFTNGQWTLSLSLSKSQCYNDIYIYIYIYIDKLLHWCYQFLTISSLVQIGSNQKFCKWTPFLITTGSPMLLNWPCRMKWKMFLSAISQSSVPLFLRSVTFHACEMFLSNTRICNTKVAKTKRSSH